MNLYGLQDSERMYSTVQSLFDSELDDDYFVGEEEWTVEEWSVADPLNLIPSTYGLLEYIQESLCEEHTHENDACGHIFNDPEVLVAVGNLCNLIAGKVTWKQADRHLADHQLTMKSGELLLDGKKVV